MLTLSLTSLYISVSEVDINIRPLQVSITAYIALPILSIVDQLISYTAIVLIIFTKVVLLLDLVQSEGIYTSKASSHT